MAVAGGRDTPAMTSVGDPGPAGPRGARDDVVGHGDEPSPGGLPPWARRAALVVAVIAALLVVSRTGLLSAGGSAPPPAPGPAQDAAPPRLVARDGDRLLVAVRHGSRAATSLPAGLPAGARLVAAPPEDSVAQGLDVGPLVGVARGRLFRADPAAAAFRWLAPADEVLAPALSASTVAVRRGSTVQAVEVGSGATTDTDPFPGYDGTASARGLLAALGTKALVMSRPVGDGTTALSLAWPARLVTSGVKPEVQQLGVFGPLLGVADDWVITLDPACTAGTDVVAACHLRVISVTQDLVQANDVAPPAGWSFVPGAIAGQTHEALVPVRRLVAGTPDGPRALARLVPGGDNALLVLDTEQVVSAGGLADGVQGTVYLLSTPAPGAGRPLQVRIWDPQHPSGATLTRARWSFPRSARLLCLCR